MTLTAHIAVGSAIGYATGNPVLGFFAGFLSHHIIDSIAHSDAGSLGSDIENIFKDKIGLFWVFIDILLAGALFLVFLVHTGFSPVIFWGAVGGAMPDIIDNSPFWSPSLRKTFPTNYFHKFHDTIHWTITSKKYLWVGFLTQAILIGISTLYLFHA